MRSQGSLQVDKKHGRLRMFRQANFEDQALQDVHCSGLLSVGDKEVTPVRNISRNFVRLGTRLSERHGKTSYKILCTWNFKL